MLVFLFGPRINNSEWSFVKVKQSIHPGMYMLYDFIQLIKTGDQDDERLVVGTTFDGIHALDSVLVRRIATDSPNGVRWVEEYSAPLKGKNGLLDDLLDGFPVHCDDNQII